MNINKSRRSQARIQKFGPASLRRILPDAVVEKIAAKYGGDTRKRKLTTVVHLWLLIQLQLDGGVRCLDGLLQRAWEGLRKAGFALTEKAADKSALSRKNTHRPHAIFQDVFYWLVDAYRERFGKTVLKGKLGEKELASIDSTVVNLVNRLYRWFYNSGKHRKAGHGQAKVHVLYRNGPTEALISRGNVHDSKWARKLLRKLTAATLVVFDRGYWDHAFFIWLVNLKHDFITRLKDNVKPRKIKRLGKGDWLVRFDASPSKAIPFALRLVQWKTESGETLEFVTSLLDPKAFPPEAIAAFYVQRWEIETFFRDLKHVLRLSHFVSYSANGIRLQIYAALITFVLVQYVRAEAAELVKVKKEELSIKRTVDIIGIWLGADIARCYAAPKKEALAQWEDLLLLVARYAYRKRKSHERVSLAGKRSSERAA